MIYPLFSFIVPVFNAEEYLSVCIESIRNQSLGDMEIILVDDGSTDNSGIICDAAAKSDKRISVIHQSNCGPGAARNAALRIASGHWLLFVDADDYLHHKYAEKLYNAAKELSVGCVLCGSVKIQNEERTCCPICDALQIVRADDCIRSFVLKKDKLHIPFAVTTRIICNDVFKKSKVTFPESYVYEDLIVSYKTLMHCERVGMIPDCLYYRRILNTSITHSNSILHLLDKRNSQKIFFAQLREDYPHWEHDIRRGEEKRRIGIIKDMCRLWSLNMPRALHDELLNIYSEAIDYKNDLHLIEDADDIADLDSIVLPTVVDGEQ